MLWASHSPSAPSASEDSSAPEAELCALASQPGLAEQRGRRTDQHRSGGPSSGSRWKRAEMAGEQRSHRRRQHGRMSPVVWTANPSQGNVKGADENERQGNQAASATPG
jgi:hypothetical protein